MKKPAASTSENAAPRHRRKRWLAWAAVFLVITVPCGIFYLGPMVGDFMQSPFAYSVEHGYVWIVENRLAADPSLLNKRLWSPEETGPGDHAPAVFLAAGHGQTGVLKVLLAHGARTTFRHRRLLDWSVWNRHFRVAWWLVAHGFPLTARAAAGLGDVNELRKLVRLHPTAAEAAGYFGNTPLSYAVVCDQYPTAKWLLQHGVNPMLPEPTDITYSPLSWAAFDGNVRLVKLLVSFGAPLDTMTGGGKTDRLVDHIVNGNWVNHRVLYFFQGVKAALPVKARDTIKSCGRKQIRRPVFYLHFRIGFPPIRRQSVPSR